MYLVTGGAGFIGSNLVAELSKRGEEVVVCDWMRSDERWRNLAKHELAAVIAPPQLSDWLRRQSGKIDGVLHMGAISTTTETNVDLIVENNVRPTLDLLQWCTESGIRLIYASSAATYGDGSAGFDDDPSPEALARLRPLNAYAWSKHLVDRRVARLRSDGAPLPPQIVGLKFFNVYGPNEYHKGGMRSVVAQNFAVAQQGGELPLFRSYRSEYADGCQLRDFIYVRDCVDVVMWLIDHPAISGLFNVGTGNARSWLDLAHALFAAVGREPKILFIDMPTPMIEKYQYVTEAKMIRLRAAGYSEKFTELEVGIERYVRSFLCKPDPYG